MKRIVSVLGKSGHISPEVAAVAEAIGAGIARRGYVLVCGGRDGVMEAVCRGAAQEGGLSIGIMPGYTTEDANQWLCVALPTGLGYARNTCVAAAGEVAIAIDGSYGTLSEIAMARSLCRQVIGVGTWHTAPDDTRQLGLHYAANAQEALTLLDTLMEQQKESDNG